MAIAIDASSPIRYTGVNTPITSAAFTAPANALLVLCHEYDGNSGGLVSFSVSDTGTLIWTKQVERDANEGTVGGGSAIWTARTTSAVSRTVQASTASSFRHSAKLYVVTGVDVDGTPVDTVAAANEGTSATNNLTTTSVTPGASGLLFIAAADWTAGGGANAYEAPSDGSTQDTANYSGEISAVDGYKTATSGVALGMNLNAGGAAAAQQKWCQIVVRAAAAATRSWILTR